MTNHTLEALTRQQWLVGLRRLGSGFAAGGLGQWVNEQCDRLGAGVSSIGTSIRDTDTAGRHTAMPSSAFVLLAIDAQKPIRVWRVSFRPGSIQAADRIVAIENQGGFQLREIQPLNALRWQDREHITSFTSDLLLVFSPTPGARSFRISADLCREYRDELADQVESPILGCKGRVPRMTRSGPNLDSNMHASTREQFRCPSSGAILSPSTFEYADARHSLLWQDDSDIALISSIQVSGKATWARMGRERDEDSLTWNLFRYLQRREDRLSHLDHQNPSMAHILLPSDGAITSSHRSKVIYWATDTDKGTRNADLDGASAEVKESGQRTEPDIIIDVEDGPLVFVEVKFMSTPYTTPTRPEALPNYANHPIFSQLFSGTIESIAIESQCYQLMRLWLIGNLMAQRTSRSPSTPRPFRLISLVRDPDSADLTKVFSRFIVQPDNYKVITWTQICHRLQAIPNWDIDGQILARYLNEKTAGYAQVEGRQKLIKLIPSPVPSEG